ncbi:hypothetical protein [Halarcobacter sp.]|uniref:hypothetical protein n=1 Tax=Halarcobacter sp. TaxID=2321133 RepID=UPI003A914010
MSNIYNKNLNDFTRKYLISNNKLSREDILFQGVNYNNIKAQIFEDLLLYDKTTFKVYGENIPLAFLINELSVKGIERLIEKEDIQFALWTPSIMHVVSNIKGVVPLCSGRLNSPVHCEPEQSIESGLNFLTNLSQKNKKIIKRKLRDKYIIPKEGIETESKEFTISAFKSNKFTSYGLNNEEDLTLLSKEKKETLNKCASDLLEYKFTISEQLTINRHSEFEPLFRGVVSNCIKHDEIVNEIITIENFPNLKEVFFNLKKTSFKDIIKLREKNNIKKFRNWLNEISDNVELNDVTKEYIDSIENSKGFFETKKGRFTKNITMSLLGAGVGSIAGPMGTAIGGVTGSLISPSADFALDMIDEYFISELSKGWTPRMFFDEINKLK